MEPKVLNPQQLLLTTLVSVDPVYVTFTGDERAFLRYQEIVRAGNAESPRDGGNGDGGLGRRAQRGLRSR